MASSSPKSTYWQGVRDGLPFLVVVLPFGLFFGVFAVESGMTVAQSFGFSVVVIAGAAQFAAVQLMTEDAPFAVVVATALAVNLRMAMYSAALVPHLGAAPFWLRAIMSYLNVDQNFAMSTTRFDADPGMTLDRKIAYFFGVSTPVLPIWCIGSFAGATLGQTVPESLSLDFAVPITFLAVVSLMLRTRAHWAAAVTSVVVALGLHWVPYNGGLLIAGVVAMGVGAAVETWMERRGIWTA